MAQTVQCAPEKDVGRVQGGEEKKGMFATGFDKRPGKPGEEGALPSCREREQSDRGGGKEGKKEA